MKIFDLIDNDEFSFNARYRIYQYEPPDKEDEEGEMILIYDSEDDMEFDSRLQFQDITAINQAEDGALEIEYIGSDLY